MKIILFVLLFAVLTVSGCVNDNELAGNTYEGPDGEIIRFFDDGKMHFTNDRGSGSMGVYTIEDGRVYFNAGFWTWDAEIKDKELNNDGDVFVLVEQ